jgi:hypothetical protein
MTASSKRTSSPGAPEDTGMFLRASRYREELAEEARTLRRAGKIRAAKGVENRVQQVEQLLGALEGERSVSHVRASPN